MKSDTFAYLLVLSSILGLLLDFPNWDRILIALSIIAYCLTSIWGKFKKVVLKKLSYRLDGGKVEDCNLKDLI